MPSLNRRKKAPAFAVKRPSNPPEIIDYHAHDTNDHIRRPDLVARCEATHPVSGRTVTVEVGKQKGCGFLVYGEGKAIDGFYPDERGARAAVEGFAMSLLVTSCLWLTIFALLAAVFP